MENEKVHIGKSPEISAIYKNKFLQRFCKCRRKLEEMNQFIYSNL